MAIVVLIFDVTDLLIAQAHLIVGAVVLKHITRHEGFTGHQGGSFGDVLRRTYHSDVALHVIRAEMVETFVLGLAVAIFGRLKVSAEASHFSVSGLDTARGYYRSTVPVIDTFFGYHWCPCWLRSLLILCVGLAKCGQGRRTDAKQHY